MKTNTLRKIGRAGAVSAICVCLGVSVSIAAPPSTIEGTYGTVVIGDVPGMIDSGAALAKTVSPGMSGDVIRGQLGMLLGDEGLKSIPAGSGLVIVVPTDDKPFFLLETADGKAQAVAEMIKQRGGTTKVVNDKLVAVGLNDESLNKATTEMGQSAAALLENNDDKFLFVTIDTDKLIQDKGDDLQAAIKNMQEKATKSSDPNSSGTAGALAVFGRFISAAAKRVDVATIKMDVSGNGILFEKTLYPIGGVNLGTAEGPTGQELRKQLPAAEKPLVAYEYHLDTQSAIKAITPLFMEALGPDVTAQEKAEIKQMFDKAAAGYGDAFGGWLTPTKNGSQGNYLFSIISEEQALAAIQAEIDSMKSGVLSRFYSSFGLKTSATLVKNAETINGQQIHHFSMSMLPTSGDPKGFAQIYDIRDSKIAVLANKMVMTLGDVSMQETLAAVKAGTSTGADLQARSNLPAGGFFYADYRPGALSKSMGKDAAPMEKFMSNMENVVISEAGYADEESIRCMLHIPKEMITGIAKGAKQMAQDRAKAASGATTESGDAPSTGTVPRGSLDENQ